MQTPSRRELIFLLLWAAFVVILAGLPYIIAASWAGPGRYFSGFIWGPDEGNAYLQWIRQASQGHILLANQYTTRLQNPHFFNIFLLALGQACRLFHLLPIQAYQLARLIGIPVALYAFYCLVCYLTAIRSVRYAAVIIASLSSGVGWIAVLQAYAGMHPHVAPIDCALGWQAMPEAVTYLSFLVSPLFTWSLALLCAALLWSWRALERGSLGQAFVAGLVMLVLGNVHTYDALTAYVAIGIVALILVARRQVSILTAVGLYLVIFLVSCPSLAWAWYQTRVDPAWLAKASTPTPSPPPVDYALGYGLVLLAALAGIWTAWVLRRVTWRSLAAIAWIIAGFGMAYAPVSFQRKMIEGTHLGLAYLAALGLALGLPMLIETQWDPSLAPNARSRRRRGVTTRILILFVVLTVPSNALFVYDSLGHARVNNRDLLHVLMPPVYLTKDEVAGLQWLDQHTTFKDIVLSSSLIGSYVPAWSPARVVVGHWAETLDFASMVQLVATFYAPGLQPSLREQVIKDTGATYVWWGQYEQLIQRSMASIAERALGHPVSVPDPPSHDLPLLQVAFHEGDVTIYRVLPQAPAEGPEAGEALGVGETQESATDTPLAAPASGREPPVASPKAAAAKGRGLPATGAPAGGPVSRPRPGTASSSARRQVRPASHTLAAPAAPAKPATSRKPGTAKRADARPAAPKVGSSSRGAVRKARPAGASSAAHRASPISSGAVGFDPSASTTAVGGGGRASAEP